MIQVESDASEEWDSRIGWTKLAEDAVLSAVRASDMEFLADAGAEIEGSVKFTSDGEVQQLNRDYRGKDRPTNVLSFPMVDPDVLDDMETSGAGGMLLGDIVLAHGVCASEAAARNIGVEAHASHLIVHGTLHLLGYDHEQGDAEAELMEDVERSALAAIGISDPYALQEAQN